MDSNNLIGDYEIKTLLESSPIIQELTSEFVENPLYAVWRIVALSEIPFSAQLDYTKRVVEYIETSLTTPNGFSLTGKSTDLLPCYNAILIEALSKLGYAHLPMVQNGVKWIKQYQVFERKSSLLWDGKGVQKYGGCLKATPCFIGIAKSVKELIFYDKSNDQKDCDLQFLINKGMDYILQHKLYQRLSNNQPITRHILDLAFPPSYHLNIVELLEIAYNTGNIAHPACADALRYIDEKTTKGSGWKIKFVYKGDGYLSFDKRGEKGEWISYLLNKYRI